MTNIKNKERTLKAAIDRKLPTNEYPIDCQLISQQRHFRPEGIGVKYSE